MSARRVAMFVAAAALLAAAAVVRPPAPRTGVDRVRALVRPFALPFLWRSLRAARTEEPPEALAARGQQLLALVPEWTDGHVTFASDLAFAASQRAADPDTAAGRILAALALLEAALAKHPPGAVEYLSAMASFVEIRAAQDPAVAAALRARLGVEAHEAADAYLARAEHIAPSASLADRRTYLLLPAIASALRAGDRERARLTIAVMRARLERAADPALARRWQQSLGRLDRFLAADPDITLQTLADDPLLEDMVDALNPSRR